MEAWVKGLGLGVVFGLLCAGMSLIFRPVEPTPLGLLGTVYNRALLGLLIALVPGTWRKGG